MKCLGRIKKRTRWNTVHQISTSQKKQIKLRRQWSRYAMANHGHGEGQATETKRKYSILRREKVGTNMREQKR
jgi:hypothetical protein